MGDSDEDYNSNNLTPVNSISNPNNNGSNNNNSSLGGNSSSNASGVNSNANNNSFNSNNKKNRDKFYRERDDSNNNNNSNNLNPNYNRNNDNRRDWNSDRNRGGSGNDSWKNRSGINQSPHIIQPGSGYGANNPSGSSGGGYQRMGGLGSGPTTDYQRKYSHQNSPGNYDSSPPPYKRKKDWDMNSDTARSGSGGGNLHGNNLEPVYSGGTGSGSGTGYHSSYNAMKHSLTGQHSEFNKSQNEPEYPTQPPFLSFKLFLQQQDDNISDEDAIKKYNEYKTDFKKTQINNFFLEHKEEEWFKSRYHPDENYKRRNEHNQHVLNRLEVFMDLMNNGLLENISTEYDKSKELIKFLDAVVIKLEGGNEQDLKQLETNGTSAVAQEDDVKEIKPEKKKESHRKIKMKKLNQKKKNHRT